MGGYNSRGWNVTSNVPVKAVVVAQMGGVGGGSRTVKFGYTSWWGTKGCCTRGGIIR